MDINFISREFIKPSSPDIHHQEAFELSYLDQALPFFDTPYIFFYPSTKTHFKPAQISTQLKSSLSQTLSTFYPFSGRVKDNFFIDNFDVGVPFIETQVKSHLSDFLQHPELEILKQFLPPRPFDSPSDPEATALVLIQLNVFDCGGVALGLLLSHKILDGATASTFLNCWAANLKGCFRGEKIEPELFEASLRFPPQDPSSVEPHLEMMKKFVFEEGKYVMRRFVFDAEAIAALKTKGRSECVENPSRTVALTSFIWKSCSEASRFLSASPRPTLSSHSVNIRHRAEPCFSKHSIGNLWWDGGTGYELNGTIKMELKDLVILTRDSFTKIDKDYLNTFYGDKGFRIRSDSLKELMPMRSLNPEIFIFSSWIQFDFNELDFGWGKPIWVCTLPGKDGRNEIVFKETGKNNEIEVWMTLKEKLMSIVEHDPEFLKFATPNPSVSMPTVSS